MSSLTTCLKVGAGAGLFGGLISSAFFKGAAKRADKNDNPSAFGMGAFSVGSIIGGPVVGAGTGLGFYGLNKGVKSLRAAPKPIQVAILAIAGLAAAMKGAHILGERGI